jgi:hypothetical protein
LRDLLFPIIQNGESKTMNIVDPESENSYPVFSGGTITTSGSAVIPEYRNTVVNYVAAYNNMFSDDTEEKEKFFDKIRNFYFDQMKKSAIIDEEIYNSQKIFGIVIFIVVILLVVAGIVFSILQFITAMKFGDFSKFDTTIQIQTAGNLVLTSSFVGAIVLVISLVFFFLFLQFVYKPNNRRKDYFKNIKDIKTLIE